jgi:DNA repair protein RecO (recombination protein O)
MLQTTRGIVLRSVKFGETSLISTIFTEHFGTQSYLIKGIRTAKAKSNKAGLLQPATVLDLVAYQQPHKNLQHLKEFQNAWVYTSLQEEVIKNSVALFSVELLLRLLPEHAPIPELFEFAFDYFKSLDQMESDEVANFPLYFVVKCSNFLGYELKGFYSQQTPHLNLPEGGFSEHTPLVSPFVHDEDAKLLEKILRVKDIKSLQEVEMNSQARFRLLDWYLAFLRQYAQHLGQMKSLPVLHAILH